jgi:polysaccharide biosynthesis/export protein
MIPNQAGSRMEIAGTAIRAIAPKMKSTFCGFSLLICTLFMVLASANLKSQDRSVVVGASKGTATFVESPEAKDDYMIGIEDVLAISVWKEPDLSMKEVAVRADGKISIPLVNDIPAAGLTPKQLQQQIAEKLGEFVASPNVTVLVIKSLSRSVSVVGQVNRPGTYPLGAPTTVLELLARAGGINEYANSKNIKVVRKENGKTVQFPFNYKDAIKGRNLAQNITLKIGDVVLVP